MCGFAGVLELVGGVLIVILFAVMLTSRIAEVRLTNRSAGVIPAGIALAVAVAAAALGAVTLRGRPGPDGFFSAFDRPIAWLR